MWVERIEIGGFGRLRNVSFDLHDGLNVVTGLNEAGKSTLHQAIATGLFGCFSSTDRRREQDAERRRERFAPWDGGPYRVSIVTRSAGNVALRLDWDLSGRTSFVARDATTGEERTSAIRGVGDGVLRVDTHGISRAVFERSLVVRQGELAAIADEEGAVAAALEAALASSERNASASRAVELLAAQRDSIGTVRSSKRPLQLARAEAHHLAEELREAELARAAIESTALAARAAAVEADAAARRLATSRASMSGRRLAGIEQWMERVNAVDGALGELDRRRTALADAVPVDTAVLGELEKALDARGTAAERAERARRAADEVADALSDAEARLREVEATVSQHEAYRGGPDGTALGELEHVIARLHARPVSVPVTTRRPALTLATATLALVVALVTAVSGSIVLAVAILALAIVTGALGVHWLMLERDRRRRSQRVTDDDEERRSQLLAAAGLDPLAPGAEDRFRREASARATFELASVEATTLRAEVLDLARARSESRRLDGELVETERRVRDAYLRMDLDPADEPAAAAEIETRRARATLRQSLDREHAELAAQHAGLLADRDPRALRTEALELRASGVVPETGPVQPGDDERAADAARQAGERAAALVAQFETLASGLADTSALSEQLASARDREARLERAHEVLSIAAEALAEAAADTYRDVAPHLNRALSVALERATDGRYREARVGPDLGVVVHGPERAAPVPIDDLSFGTRELVHLVQRLELARLLGGDDPPPILLDDVLGHCDAQRRLALAGLIADTSARQQVIVLATTPEAAEALLASTLDAVHIDLSAYTPTLV